MSLLQMSFSGAVLILVVIIIRTLAINRLPKMTFLILWGIVLFRLLIPFSISSAFSVYSLIDQNAKIDTLKQISTEQVITEDAITSSVLPKNNQQLNHIAHTEHNEKRQSGSGVLNKTDNGSILKKLPQRSFVNWSIIWFIGMAVCIICFGVSYLRCRFEFETSLPVEDEFSQDFLKDCSYHYIVSAFPVENTFVQKWLQKHSRWHQVSIRQSDRITTPLTYGIFHPVILMPKTTDWENTEQLQYVLMHEYVHICRYDALTKLIVISALCIHWFNPLVWIMYVLFNRDVEISCDESVVRHMGEASKSTYARMLIQMEAARSGLAPFCNGLLPKISKNAMEERITAIMKIKKKSIFAGIAAAILIISVTAAFATSATEASEAKKPTKTTETANTSEESTTSTLDTGFTEQEYEKLLALRFDGYEDMTISEFQNKVWALTDTEEYMNLLERFFADETLYTMYECKKGTDSNEISSFLYNVLAPLMVDTQQPPRGFGGYAVSDFLGASDNASLEYFVTLTILDANLLTVWEYDWARQRVMEDLGNILKDLTTSDLRDKERMTGYIDEGIENIKSMYGNSALQIAVDYAYTPLGVMAVDDMEVWQQERRDEWDRMMAPYTPFGLTYRYDWDTDDYKMYFQGKEVRGIYDEGKNLWISEHAGIGKDIYDENAIELFAVYENKKLVGLREATAQEMEDSTKRRQAVTDEYYENFQEIRGYLPATEEDYQSLLALKTSDYRSETIAEFDAKLLDWANEEYERMERIDCDRGWKDFRVALTDEERSFVTVTVWLSGMENGAYVRSLTKKEPEQDIEVNIKLPSKDVTAQNGNANAWCSLYYSFSYHILDKEKVTIGERDERIGKMIGDIENYWETSDVEELLKMTKDDMLETLHQIAAKYSSHDITITIMDERTSFESMDERRIEFS